MTKRIISSESYPVRIPVSPSQPNWRAPLISEKSLAEDSGGSRILASDIASELDRLDRQTSNYYILSFQSNNPKHDGAFRRLKVKTDLKGVTLRYRTAYRGQNPRETGSVQTETLLTDIKFME